MIRVCVSHAIHMPFSFQRNEIEIMKKEKAKKNEKENKRKK